MKPTEQDWERYSFPLESKLQAYCIRRIKKMPGIAAFKTIKCNINGVSDLILCVRGLFVAIELKTGNNKPTMHQTVFLEHIKFVGGIGYVAYNWGDVKDIINFALDKANSVVGSEETD